jgi:hypothetical protein
MSLRCVFESKATTIIRDLLGQRPLPSTDVSRNLRIDAHSGASWVWLLLCFLLVPVQMWAVVLTRNSASAYLSTVTVAPVTSTIRGVPSEVVLNEEDGMKSPCAVNLHNAVATPPGETFGPA